MKFGQLIECNMRNIFLAKSYTKCGGETRIKIEHISGSMVQNFIQFAFIVWQVEGYRKKPKLSCRPYFHLILSFFKK